MNTVRARPVAQAEWPTWRARSLGQTASWQAAAKAEAKAITVGLRRATRDGRVTGRPRRSA